MAHNIHAPFLYTAVQTFMHARRPNYRTLQPEPARRLDYAGRHQRHCVERRMQQVIIEKVRTEVLTFSIIINALNKKRLTCKLHNRNKTKKQGLNLVNFVAPTGINEVNRQRLQQ